MNTWDVTLKLPLQIPLFAPKKQSLNQWYYRFLSLYLRVPVLVFLHFGSSIPGLHVLVQATLLCSHVHEGGCSTIILQLFNKSFHNFVF